MKYEFIRKPDSPGFGDHTESGQVIPVTLDGRPGTYVHSMFLDDDAPIAGGRGIWGFPKRLADPELSHEGEVIVRKLHHGSALVAQLTMGYTHRALDAGAVATALAEPNYLLKVIPHLDGGQRICELVRYRRTDIAVQGAWSGPADFQLFRHVMADVARLPVLEVVDATHFVADLTLALGEVAHDYLAD